MYLYIFAICFLTYTECSHVDKATCSHADKATESPLIHWLHSRFTSASLTWKDQKSETESEFQLKFLRSFEF